MQKTTRPPLAFGQVWGTGGGGGCQVMRKVNEEGERQLGGGGGGNGTGIARRRGEERGVRKPD